jgi:hypothetical protein
MNGPIFANKLAAIKFNRKPAKNRLLKNLEEVFDNASRECNLFFLPGACDPLHISPKFYHELGYQLREHFRRMGAWSMSRMSMNITAYAGAAFLDESWLRHLESAFSNNLYLLTPWPLDVETEDVVILTKRYGIEPRWVIKIDQDNYIDIFLECNRLNIHFALDLPDEHGAEILRELTERWMMDKQSRVSVFPIEKFIHRYLTARQQPGQSQPQNLPTLLAYMLADKSCSRVELPEMSCRQCNWNNICCWEFLLLSNGHILLDDNPGRRLAALCDAVKDYYPFLNDLMGRIDIQEVAEYARLFF